MSPEGREIPEYPEPDAPERDGIAEEDNKIPLWFNVGFYALNVFGIVYILFYTLSGWSSAQMYAAQVERFEEMAAAAREARPDENPFAGDPQAIAQGKETFQQICAACHKPDATGLVGPSLVDPYWKYGSSDAELFHSIAQGRPAGMPAWEAQLGTEKIWKVMAYLRSLPKTDEPGVGAPAASASAGDGSGEG